jgi:formylglycine-generating enzyme
VYEYGDRYVAGLCGLGQAARPLPSGYRFSCSSGFGVHDMHGSVWEWTDSPWGRGSKRALVTLRGGNGSQGDVIGRCANGSPHDPKQGGATIGFRCCSGSRNQQEVVLQVDKGKALRRLSGVDRELGRSLIAKLPAKVHEMLRRRGLPRVLRLWEWRPLGNEDLLVAGVCAGAPPLRDCGVLVVRRTLGRLDVLDWADSGFYVPSVRLEYNPRLLWVYGGDRRSHYRRPVTFEWGKVKIGPENRNVRLKSEDEDTAAQTKGATGKAGKSQSRKTKSRKTGSVTGKAGKGQGRKTKSVTGKAGKSQSRKTNSAKLR